MTEPTAHPAASPAPRALALWTVWSVGVLAYVVSILNRTSLSAVGVDAQDRFQADASTLALFAVLQLAVYGGLQIPVGLLLDRFGSRRVMTAGMLVMAAGQLVLAVTPDVGTAIAARVLVGAGDAAVFPGVLRIIAAWFPDRHASVAIQFTGLVGQAGQILSVLPLVALLHATSWTVAFSAVAGTGALIAVLVVVLVRDTPDPVHRPAPRAARDLRRGFGEAWRHPGTRLAFWTHFSTPMAAHAFAILWGYPFLEQGQGLTAGQASLALTVYVLAGAVAGPIVGRLSGRHPLRRSWLAIGVVALHATAWTAVLLWPGRAPFWLLIALVCALAAGGPGSMVAFDFARAHNPVHRLSTATGIVNGGGFLAAVLVILALGVAMDLQGAGTPETYTLDAFKVAFLVQYPLWALGLVLLVRERRRTRAVMARAGVVVPRLRDVIPVRRP